jgi:hypothetical protein
MFETGAHYIYPINRDKSGNIGITVHKFWTIRIKTHG